MFTNSKHSSSSVCSRPLSRAEAEAKVPRAILRPAALHCGFAPTRLWSRKKHFRISPMKFVLFSSILLSFSGPRLTFVSCFCIQLMPFSQTSAKWNWKLKSETYLLLLPAVFTLLSLLCLIAQRFAFETSERASVFGSENSLRGGSDRRGTWGPSLGRESLRNVRLEFPLSATAVKRLTHRTCKLLISWWSHWGAFQSHLTLRLSKQKTVKKNTNKAVLRRRFVLEQETYKILNKEVEYETGDIKMRVVLVRKWLSWQFKGLKTSRRKRVKRFMALSSESGD